MPDDAVTGKAKRQSVKLIDLPTIPAVLELQHGNSGKPRTYRFAHIAFGFFALTIEEALMVKEVGNEP